MKIKLPAGPETRMVQQEVRLEKEDDRPIITGLGAVFNKRAEILPGLFEVIKPGAFDGVLKTDDVRGLFNHDINNLLGRKSAGTLELRTTKAGLDYKIFPPDTQVGRDVQVSIKRGDITGSSFSFNVGRNGDTWEESADGTILRTITEFSSLGDVGPVTFEAYEDTTVAARSLDSFRAEPDEAFQQEALDGEAQEEIEIESDAREREMEMAGRG